MGHFGEFLKLFHSLPRRNRLHAAKLLESRHGVNAAAGVLSHFTPFHVRAGVGHARGDLLKDVGDKDPSAAKRGLPTQGFR